MINHYGCLKFGVKVLLCFAYRFAMFTLKFYNFGETCDHGNRFLRFLSFEVVGCTKVVLHVGPFFFFFFFF